MDPCDAAAHITAMAKQSETALKLKELRKRSGLRVREIAGALHRPSSSYAFYEDEFKKPFLPVDLVHDLAPIFEPRGIAKSELYALAGVDLNQMVEEPRSSRGNATARPEESPAHAEASTFVRDVPIYEGALCGEDGAFDFESQVADYAPRPPRLKNVQDAYALYVRGNSMEPWREHGQLVYVHPAVPARPNDYVVVQLKPAPGGTPPAYIKRLVGQSAKDLRLLQYNPRKYLSFQRSRVLKIQRIMEWAELLGA